jgi:hypothetical protein
VRDDGLDHVAAERSSGSHALESNPATFAR